MTHNMHKIEKKPENLNLPITDDILETASAFSDVLGQERQEKGEDHRGKTYGEDLSTDRENSIQTDIKSAFQMFDLNQDGYISSSELIFVMKKEMNEDLSPEVAEMMILEADLEGKGKVNFEEFCLMMADEEE